MSDILVFKDKFPSAVGTERLSWHGLIPVEEMTRAVLHVDTQVREGVMEGMCTRCAGFEPAEDTVGLLVGRTLQLKVGGVGGK